MGFHGTINQMNSMNSQKIEFLKFALKECFFCKFYKSSADNWSLFVSTYKNFFPRKLYKRSCNPEQLKNCI